jgi:hypothetical protein
MPRKPKIKYTPDELKKETLRLSQLISSGQYTSFFNAVTVRDRRFSVSTLYRTYKKLRDNPSATIRKKGRPYTLSDDQENTLVQRIHSVQDHLSHITNDIIVREAVSVAGQMDLGLLILIYIVIYF